MDFGLLWQAAPVRLCGESPLGRVDGLSATFPADLRQALERDENAGEQRG
jgi:hypothetical protein